jgi:hypothetical protein
VVLALLFYKNIKKKICLVPSGIFDNDHYPYIIGEERYCWDPIVLIFFLSRKSLTASQNEAKEK